MSTTTTALEIQGLKTRLKETWMAGDYDRLRGKRKAPTGRQLPAEDSCVQSSIPSAWQMSSHLSSELEHAN
jgi:hypothetical protein